MDNTRKSFHEGFKRHIVAEIESGNMSMADAAREYGITKPHVRTWLADYGRFRPKKDIVEVVMKSEKEKIAELEKALAEAHLKIRVYDELINQAGKKLKVDIKKTFGTAQSELSGETDTASKKSRKRSK